MTFQVMFYDSSVIGPWYTDYVKAKIQEHQDLSCCQILDT